MIQNQQNSAYCKNTKYVLFGMTIHLGYSLRSGHYYSIIRRNNKWYQCNDNKVTELKPYKTDKNGYIFFDKIDKESNFHNGYLFFYRRINSL